MSRCSRGHGNGPQEASLHPAGIVPLNDKRASAARGSERSLAAPSESFVFPLQRVLAGAVQTPLSLLVAPKLGFHPWPGPRDAGWFSPAEEAVLSVSADGPVASTSVRGFWKSQLKRADVPLPLRGCCWLRWKWPWG